MSRWLWICLLLGAGILTTVVIGGIALVWFGVDFVTATEYHTPPPDPAEVLEDDRLEDKKPKFDPTLVDRRPLQGWLVNSSDAVIRLDVPIIKPDQEPHLLRLHASCADALRQSGMPRSIILPSVNLIDGKAKQFDDGLYAALDQAYYKGLDDKLHSHVQLVRRLYDKVGKDSAAAPYLAAGLELAGVKVEVTDRAAKDARLREFLADQVRSKPIGFYTWNDTLSACFRFLRFFQKDLDSPTDVAISRALAQALAQDDALLADYKKALTFYAKLTNPYTTRSVADMAAEVAQGKKGKGPVALFPASTSREYELFTRLFPNGLPPNADLMREMIRAIRSGKIDLKPRPDSGWYDCQVYALETLLLPEKSEERDKLLLTKAYKKRMLEAFKSLMTNRRETHVRQLAISGCDSAPVPAEIKPRLRVEPCPSYFLRTARAYAFLANFLEATVGLEALKSLHGLRREGPRDQDLLTELHFMRDLFYGLYLVSAEDIGLKPAFASAEPVEQDRCYELAARWLERAFDDKDLAVDTRGTVPIFWDANNQVTRLWTTLGVRLAKLDVSYVRPPRIKPKDEGDKKDWQPAPSTSTAHYMILVDEFAEVEIAGNRTLTREEWRALCDREKTKWAILAAVRSGK